MDKVPIVYAYLYAKLKKRNQKRLVKTIFLKQIIKRIIISKPLSPGEFGGDRKGIPKHYIHDIIQDMEELELIKKVDKTKYQILQNECIKNIRQPFW